MAAITEMVSVNDWLDVVEASATADVMILKHSTRCPVSASAYREFQKFAESGRVRCALVKIIEHRGVSNAIAEDTGVRHESPQAFLIQNRKVVWNASHYGITEQSLKTAAETAR